MRASHLQLRNSLIMKILFISDIHGITKNLNIIEDKIKNYLIEHNIEFKQQYKSKEYPYSCDFYIKSLDLFIELNLHWTHGDHPYNESDSRDVELKESLAEKAKTSEYYRNALYVWTDLDVRKQRIAKENNLNYKAVYSVA